MITTKTLTRLVTELRNFEWCTGEDAVEKLKRGLLFLNLWTLEYNSHEYCSVCRDFYIKVFKLQKDTETPTHLIIATCLENEVARRTGKPVKGISLAKFLEETRELEKLVKYVEYLLYNKFDDSVLNEDTKVAEKVALEKGYEMYIATLDYVYSNVNYGGNASK